ncbi:potassium transporter 5-like [Phalaenopsis equestris]|uniref:potassium transporter 5-like n=1 Tax=Phalaenopsis equestris TaxID=78828 RepID=UPI0009E3F9A8|nr:potassium transporter 5-like [Phalaenopsis equestris]
MTAAVKREAKQEEDGAVAETEADPKGKKLSWGKLRGIDSFNFEAGRIPNIHDHGIKVGWTSTFSLAFQSIGVVYGDIGTSPLYVYSSTFIDGIKEKDDILGVLSLILYTLIIIPLIKYVFIVLWANDDGDGGTFALYSLISRHVKISLIPNQQAEDAMLSNYRLETPSKSLKRAQWIKNKLESRKSLQIGLLLITILATSMIIGDGVLTPAISVLSAVSGIKEKATSLSQGQIALISIVILVLVFSVQRFGTDKVGYTFAPIIVLWFSLIGGIGVYNLVKYDVRVLRAFNPKYIVDYFRRNGKKAWTSLGGIVLCITGTEAMFADLSHFSVRAIQISFTAVLFPAVSLAYIGQASYLTKFPEEVHDTFYKSIPGPLFWPSFIIAIAAAIIASQAMISGAFSIIQQSQGLSCFPRVRVVHTSAEYEGQVYIPEINYALMVASVLVTGIFRSTTHIGNAYGIAVVSVMLITTALVTLVMLLIWKTSIWWISLFVITVGGVEAIYLSAVLSKFVKGGFLPLAFAFFLMVIMGIWHYVHVQHYKFELENKVSSNFIQDLASDRSITRIPGIGLLYSELVQGIPPIFRQFIDKIPSIHSVFVFVSVKHIPISKVEPHERFLFRQLEPREFRLFKCVVRYGYRDAKETAMDFEKSLIKQLKEFVYHEFFIREGNQSFPNCQLEEPGTETTETNRRIARMAPDETLKPQGSAGSDSSGSIRPANSNRSGNSSGIRAAALIPAIEEEKQFIQKEMERGVVYLLGETEMVAKPSSSIIKRAVVNNMYQFIKRNFRQGDEAMSIPKSRLLKVGVTYEI